jgi:FlaG/FlaF family flagellin (archaellin)
LRNQIYRVKKSAKALSPVISVLLIIAITVVASLVAYAWVNNYLGTTTLKIGKEIQIQSMAIDPLSGNLIIYLQNVGQGSITLDPRNSVYLNGKPEPSDITPAVLAVGQTSTITTTYQITTDVSITVKVVTTEGTAAQGSTPQGFFHVPTSVPTQDQYRILFANATGGLASTPSNTHWYSANARIPIFASANPGYSFSKWTANNTQITFDNSTGESTWATINGNGTIIATFTQNKYRVTFSMETGGATLNPSGTQEYTLNTRIPITTSATSGYAFSTWTKTGQIVIDNSTSALTSVTINGAGTVTANFTQNQFLVGFSTNGIGTITPAGNQSYNPNQQITIAATPGTGYTFSTWTATGSIALTQADAATTTATINSPGQITANFNIQTKASPVLTCVPDPKTLIQGETVASTGTLTDSNQGLPTKTVTISYSLPGQSPTIHTQTTNILSGAYSDSFVPNKAGQWTVQVSFAGDSNYNPASSDIQIVTVNHLNPVKISFKTNIDGDTDTATIITVDSLNYTYDDLQVLSFNWTPNTTHKIIAPATVPTLVDNKQYVWASWNAPSFGTSTTTTYTYAVASTDENLTLNFVPQTQILFAYYDVYDTYTEADPQVTYYSAGLSTTIQATKYGSENVWVDVGTICTYPEYLPTTQTNQHWQTLYFSGIIEQTDDWIQPFYYGQYKISLSYNVTGGGNPSPPTFTAYQLGELHDQNLSIAPTDYWIDDFSYSITSSLEGSASPDEIWQLAQPSDGFISEIQLTATFVYYHQFALTVTTNPADLTASFQVTCTQFGIQYVNQEQTTTWSEWIDGATTATISSPQDPVGALRFKSAAPNQTVTMNQPQQIIFIYG